MDRRRTWQLVCEYTASDSLRKHMLAVEAAMRAYAGKFGEDEEKWGIVGLLHDFDYERWPDPPDHPLKGAEILAAARLSGGRDLRHQVARRLSARLPARLAGWTRRSTPATSWPASSRPWPWCGPSGIAGMQASSVKKKLKQKGFAAGVNRDDIARRSRLGVELDEHIQFVIDAMAEKAAELRSLLRRDAKVDGGSVVGTAEATEVGRPGQRLALRYGLVDAVSGMRASQDEK